VFSLAMLFDPDESSACKKLVEMALAEDLGKAGDVTSLAIIPHKLRGQADFVVRSPGVLAGIPAAQLVLSAVDSRLRMQKCIRDGTSLRAGDCIAHLRGPMQAMLAAERTALNFLTRLSGIATLTQRYVKAIAGLPCQIFDTRKTTPGWRLLEKYAVRQGGGKNHRMGLYDGVLIKDNHLAAICKTTHEIGTVVSKVRGFCGNIEIEVDTLQQLDDALGCVPYLPDSILLDNMMPDELREAVRRRKAVAPHVKLEASGGVTLANVRAIAEIGVDRISVGALTHSAPALDIALDYTG
jgi:nicotinate-nucleotide pyrophosphorylase (carboxylating)